MAERVAGRRSGEEDQEKREGESESARGRLCDGFLDRLSGLINRDNVDLILTEQESMLDTLEMANEKLLNLNRFSEKSFEMYVAEFRGYTQSLATMKRELDSIFRRIRLLKSRAAVQYPLAYGKAQATLQAEQEAMERLEGGEEKQENR